MHLLSISETKRLYFESVIRSGAKRARAIKDPDLMKTTHHHASEAEAGFTLIELLIVMSVILILMTLAIPAMQNVNKRAHQTSAVASLRMLNQMEGNYNSDYPQRGFACSLSALGGKAGSGTPTAEAAQLIPEDLASGNKAGYTFTVSDCSKTTVNNQDQYNTYKIFAVPNSPGHSGDNGYCTDESAQIRFDPKGGTNCTDLLQ